MAPVLIAEEGERFEPCVESFDVVLFDALEQKIPCIFEIVSEILR